MRALRWAIGVPVGLFLLVLVSCQIAYPTYTFRYRLTVEVNTPQGLKAGSSVIEAKWKRKDPLGEAFSGGLPWSEKVRGTAPIVDLGPYGTLIAGIWKRGGFGPPQRQRLPIPAMSPATSPGGKGKPNLVVDDCLSLFGIRQTKSAHMLRRACRPTSSLKRLGEACTSVA